MQIAALLCTYSSVRGGFRLMPPDTAEPGARRLLNWQIMSKNCNDKPPKRWKGRTVCSIPALFVISLVLHWAG